MIEENFNTSLPSTIQQIDKVSINQICSGQVVLNLATAVKELLENSIDAGATSIQIRLVEYGSESIEVIDNGSGVEEHNFEALTLKHHTSKLTNFSDLIQVETLGFRGEALSSLCSLSDVSISTRHKSIQVGTKLNFDNNGIITKKSTIARQIGTTVTLNNIFKTLPVRHREFLRNLKKEFAKMCNVVYAYCLQSLGVSISCKNQTSNKTNMVVETRGESVCSNIISIFSIKQFNTLLEVKLVQPSCDILEEFGLKSMAWTSQFSFNGYISSSVHGSGRSSADRQYLFINSRPVDNNKISRVINEVYHQYNNKQYPFFCLNVRVDKESVDINVTPDKRQIFLDNEKLLLACIKSSLLQLYCNQSSSVVVNNTVSARVTDVNIFDKLKLFQRTNVKDCTKRKSESSSAFIPSKQPCLDKFVVKTSNKSNIDNLRTVEKSFESIQSVSTLVRNITNEDPVKHVAALSEPSQTTPLQVITSSKQLPEDAEVIFKTVTDSPTQIVVEILEKKIVTEKLEKKIVTEVTKKLEKEIVTDVPKKDSMVKSKRKTVKYQITFEELKKNFNQFIASRNKGVAKRNVRFHTRIDSSNENVNKELNKQLSKSMFKDMKIIGQFNLGFIIARHDSDLFLIDQHASDEKYNFETLQQTTVINTQRLVVPLTLELTVANEEILIDNGDIIKRNGFDFIVDDNQVSTKRCKLTAVPFSKNYQFGKEDVDELLFMLSDAPATMCRPSRVRAMFASRACRKSVMIGTALSQQEMQRIVDHMGDIEQPWNCPHGRPTIRHLVNLDMLQT